MNEIAIRARHLKKVYRLYSKPHYRFLDMFSLLPERPGQYSEHAALDDVSLDIRRGEKVAVIGRNGAGKSTFLKLVTKVIEPTSGEITVAGKVHALLQIGTGFHPDFSGRQNVYAYLAQLGITGREAQQRCVEIIEFAELEDYIDQPVKTYSSGMSVRLMFSTSTAITPDLLVLDEVLGVGDAYFAHKSYERTRELCDSSGTTLLLVTHDIYSAMNICDRVVWIDRGRVLMDDTAPAVIKAYEDSIRQQEESRLRTRKQQRVRVLAENKSDRAVLVEIFARGNQPQPSPVYFSQIELLIDGVAAGSLPIVGDGFDEALPAHLQREGGCWGEAVEWRGREARPFLNYGSPFHKVAGVINLPSDTELSQVRLELAVEYWMDGPCAMGARCFPAGPEQSMGDLPIIAGQWVRHVAVADDRQAGTASSINASGRQGTATVAIADVRAVNAMGQESHQFRTGEAFELRVAYSIRQPDFAEPVQVQVAFHKDGGAVVCRFLGKALMLDAKSHAEGVIGMAVDALPLMVGQYSITAMIVRDGYFDEPQAVYYSINSAVYASVSRVLDITVSSRASIAVGSGVVCQAAWWVE